VNAPARREQKCYRCGAGVIWANLDGRAPVAVERCRPGLGDVAFQRQIGAAADALVSVNGSGWRRHVCPDGAAFSGRSGRKSR
jgi:hypothetical protein